MKNLFKKENASMTIYVAVSIFSFMIILTAVFFASSAVRKSQIQTIPKIKETYEQDIDNINQIYEDRKSQEQQYIQEGLILHYDGINNTGNGHSSTTTTWKDLSGNGNDGIVTGGTWEDNFLKFTISNDTNGVRTNNSLPLDFSSKTFNIIFNLSQVNSVEALIGARTTTTNGFMLFNYANHDALDMDVVGSSTRVQIGDRLKVNTNYNLTITLDNGTLKLYIDGKLKNTVNYKTGSVNFPLSIFTAGTRNNSLGYIYSVKVYDRALTADEVMQNSNIDKERFKW